MAAAERPHRKRAAILTADLCGYSRLVAQDQEGTLARLMEDRRLIAATVAAHAGRVFNTAGDAVLAEFASAADALRAAVDIQEAIASRGRSPCCTGWASRSAT